MFPERLKQLRKEKGMTQLDLAQALGVSGGTVAMWETGKRKPQFETLAKLCDLFDTNSSFLMGSSEDPSSERLSDDDIEQLGAWAVEEDYEDVIRKYSLLDDFGQKAVDGLLRAEFARCQEQGTLRNGESVAVSVHVRTSAELRREKAKDGGQAEG